MRTPSFDSLLAPRLTAHRFPQGALICVLVDHPTEDSRFGGFVRPAPVGSVLRTGSPFDLDTAYKFDNVAFFCVSTLWTMLNVWFVRRAILSYLGAPIVNAVCEAQCGREVPEGRVWPVARKCESDPLRDQLHGRGCICERLCVRATRRPQLE